jgi:hypothetical protein
MDALIHLNLIKRLENFLGTLPISRTWSNVCGNVFILKLTTATLILILHNVTLHVINLNK